VARAYKDAYSKGKFVCPECGCLCEMVAHDPLKTMDLKVEKVCFPGMPLVKVNQLFATSTMATRQQMRCQCCNDNFFLNTMIGHFLKCNNSACGFQVCSRCFMYESGKDLMQHVRQRLQTYEKFYCDYCEQVIENGMSCWVSFSPKRFDTAKATIRNIRARCCSKTSCLRAFIRKKTSHREKAVFRFYKYGQDSLYSFLATMSHFDLNLLPLRPVCCVCGSSTFASSVDFIAFCLSARAFSVPTA